MQLARRILLGLAVCLLGLSPGLGAAALAHGHVEAARGCGEFAGAAEACTGVDAERAEAPCPVCQALSGIHRLGGPTLTFELRSPSLHRTARPVPCLSASRSWSRAHGARAPPFPA